MSNETIAIIKKCGDVSAMHKNRTETEIEIFAPETYGFNPGQNLDVKTNLDIVLPDGMRAVITTVKPLCLIGSPFFDGGRLTLRLHNSYVGKHGAYIISKDEPLCRLTMVRN